MPRSQAHGHRRGRAQAQMLPCRRARKRFRAEVVVEFLLENSTVDLSVPMEPGYLTTVTARKDVILYGPARHGL
jgi:hypothetical protein